jgi:uncharacterized integral membrane protein
MKINKKHFTYKNIVYGLIAGIILMLAFIVGFFISMFYHIPPVE